jgi:N-acetylmuramoyl-L-alanine amidase
MKIVDHKLEGCWKGQSPNVGGALNKPTLLVMHFTASGGEGPEGDRNFFLSAAAKASAHIIVGRNGVIEQVVPFNVKAWHAGKSVWRGVPNCNDFSIGIEVDNWGAVTRTEDGKFRSWTSEVVPPDRVAKMTHKNDTAPRYWETYNEKQLLALTEATRAILDAYPSIREIVGHDDIAPKRKVDPGPAFPMSRFTGLADGRDNKTVETRTVVASALNVRAGMGTQFDIVGHLTNGEKVDVIYDAPGPWAQVKGRGTDGVPVLGWVADQYLH